MSEFFNTQIYETYITIPNISYPQCVDKFLNTLYTKGLAKK